MSSIKLQSELSYLASLFNKDIYLAVKYMLNDFPWKTQVSKAVLKSADGGNLYEWDTSTLNSVLSSQMMEEERGAFIELVEGYKKDKTKAEVNAIASSMFDHYRNTKIADTVTRFSENPQLLLDKLKEIPSTFSGADGVEIYPLGSKLAQELIEDELGDLSRVFPTNFRIVADATPYKGYLPGQVVMFCSIPGQGKSAAMLQEIALILTDNYTKFHEGKADRKVKVLWCFTGDTEIIKLDGTTESLKSLYNRGATNFEVYSSDELGRPCVSIAEKVEITGYTDELYEIEVEGKTIKCTEDHLFMLIDGTYKKAKDLTTDDELMGFDFQAPSNRYSTYCKVDKESKGRPGDGYTVVMTDTGAFNFAHKLVGNLIESNYSAKGLVVHHKDEVKTNNLINNIKVLTPQEHMRIHKLAQWQDPDYATKTKNQLVEYTRSESARIEQGKRTRKLNLANWKKPEYRKKQSEQNAKQSREFWGNPENVEKFKIESKIRNNNTVDNRIKKYFRILHFEYGLNINCEIWDSYRSKLSGEYNIYISSIPQSSKVLDRFGTFENLKDIVYGEDNLN